MNIRVECYSGYRGEETPRAIWLGERKIAVTEIIDRWLSPDHRYFKFRGYDAVGADSLLFSADSTHFAYSMRRGDQWFVVLDGKEGPGWEDLGAWETVDGLGTRGLLFSQDSQHFAYKVKAQSDLTSFLVIDGRPGPRYHWMGRTGCFRNDNTIEYLTMKNQILYRVRRPLHPRI